MSFHPLHKFLAALALAYAALIAMPATAQDAAAWQERFDQRGADVVAVLKGEKPREEVFTETFNAQVTEQALQAMMRQTEAQVGALLGLESVTPGPQPGSATLTLRFEQATVSGPMQLETAEPWLIAGLLLNQIQPLTDAGTPVVEQVAALPGVANLLFARLDGSPALAEYHPEEQLALGSTFKLYVLSTLVQQVAAGRRKWDDVVLLEEKSFPSGILQDWPLGTPMTLQALATLMISISDNTATDQLIATLGREAVEAEVAASGHSAPDRNRPFLTTREVFVLKSASDVNLGEYASAGTPDRLALLQALAERDVALPQVSAAFAGAPRAIDVEWFASPHDIARVFDRIKEDPVALGILGVNTAIGEDVTAAWDYVGFKGGSEPGVLNMSWLLRDKAGAWYVLTLGWNNPAEPVASAKLLAIARSALATVHVAGE